MRILFVTNNYTPYSGGVVSSINATVNALQSQGHDVAIVTLNFLGTKHQDPDYVKRVTCPIRFMYKKNYMALPLKPTQDIIFFAKKYKPDIIHVHHPFLLGVSGSNVARILDVPCVFTYHTMYEQYAHYVPLFGNTAKPIIRCIVARFCAQVDGIVVPSDAIKNDLRAVGVISPIEIIPSPLRTLFLQTTADTKSKSKNTFFDLILVSRFTKEKNIPFVFEVFKQLPQHVRLTLVGYGAEYQAMQEYAFDIMLLSRERVIFVHKPEPEHLRALYQSADLFIFPSQTDTQGLVLAEAMSQGLPVVALDGPGQRDIIRNGENGFIVTGVAEAVRVIQRIMSDSPFHHALKTQSKITAEKYHPLVLIKQLLNFYNLLQSKI